jgi:CubicO group peptidase (beta-lactamase class C family)
MTFARFIGEFKGRLELQPFLSRDGRWCSLVTMLGMIMLFIASPALGQSGGTHTALDQVNQAVQETQRLCADQIGKDAVPGLAIAVVFQDHVIYAAGFGVRDVNSREPVNADTVFQLASLSKAISSTVVAELVGEGKISWDSRISDIDPNFEMYDPWVTREITIRDFYAHRSGLPAYAGDALEVLGFNREQILHRLRYQKPNTSFRSHFAYTNFGVTEAAWAAAKACNLTWEDASEQKLYRPLGMSSTSSRYADFSARANKASGHVQVDGKWVQKYKRDPDPQSPAGGVSSSVNDLAQWMRLQLADGQFEGRGIVDKKALAETHSPEILIGSNPQNGLPMFYGLGWFVSYDKQGRLLLWHNGIFTSGAATIVELVPSEHLGIVVLTNAFPPGVGEGLAFTFTDVALYGKATQDWLAFFKKVYANAAALGGGIDYSKPPAAPAPALATGAYLGTYANTFYGEIQIIEQGDGLAIVEGPSKLTFALKHYDRDLFTCDNTEGETTGVTFAIGADGQATTVVVEDLNLHGDGTFQRRSAEDK